MKRVTKLSLAVLSAIGGLSPVVYGAEPEDGFVEGSKMTVTSRTFYFNRDNRNGESGAGGAGYSEATAQSFIAKFNSGYTQGTVGFGLDAFAMIGLKLDTGGGRNGARSSFDVIPVDGNGDARDEWTKVGGAVKVKAFDTEVKIGDVFPSVPVVAFGDSRVLPESFKGTTFSNTSFKGLTLQGGRLHAMSQPVSSNMNDGFATFYAGPVNSPWMAYFGGDYVLNENVSFALYGGRLKDAWNQTYVGTNMVFPLTDNLAVVADANYYRSVDEGRKLLGEFNNSIWSGRVGLQFGGHTISVSHQRNNGDDDFDYLRQSDSIFLDNSIQYADFNSPKEKSWMVRYDLNMKPYGIPGLSFMTRYGRGSDIDYSNANSVYMRRDADGNPLTNQKRWERDFEAKYVVQSGKLKDASFRIRQTNTRATQFESDLDEFRLIVEYPITVL
jgi:hypothetical protein